MKEICFQDDDQTPIFIKKTRNSMKAEMKKNEILQRHLIVPLIF